MQLSYDTDYFWKGREGKGREGKEREGKAREGKGRQEKAREGDRQRIFFNLFLESVLSYTQSEFIMRWVKRTQRFPLSQI